MDSHSDLVSVNRNNNVMLTINMLTTNRGETLSV